MAEAKPIDWQSATPMPTYARRTKDPQWERKQQQREYRVASRREKRLRKADEKKQRKLNATILRRMTRNPEKYNKNADRNRARACEAERWKIREAAMQQVRELAAIHDPTGEMFNIGPVIVTEDGKVRSETAAKRWIVNQAKRARQEAGKEETGKEEAGKELPGEHGPEPARIPTAGSTEEVKEVKTRPKPEPKPKEAVERPKPQIPQNIRLPPGQENWLALWDLTDAEIDARLKRAKRKAAAQRKALRTAQQTGKAERRLARDEKRKVYRQLKETWKSIKGFETKHKKAVKAVEDREGKVIAVKIANHDRQRAMEICEALGCTIENTPGTDEIKPRLLGMKGQHVDFNDLEFGEEYMDIRLKSEKDKEKPLVKTNRVDLSNIPSATQTLTYTGEEAEDDVAGGGDFIRLNIGEGQEYQALNLNHKLRKKIRKAIDRVQLQKELLVRSRVKFLLEKMGVDIPPELSKYGRPRHIRGQRVLESGLVETDKKTRIRLRVELAEFNQAAKVLRKQAKRYATEAGLRKYAEATKRIPVDPSASGWHYGVGWKEPEVEDPRNIVRPEDVQLARRDQEQADREMDDIYSWADEDENKDDGDIDMDMDW